jgi:hypothetical protein
MFNMVSIVILINNSIVFLLTKKKNNNNKNGLVMQFNRLNHQYQHSLF